MDVLHQNNKEQFDIRFMIKAPMLSRQGFNMLKHTVFLRAHMIFYDC